MRARRERSGLTQRELAERAGVSERAVRYIEQGRVDRPRRESVRKLAEAVGLPVDEQTQARVRGEPGRLRIGVLGPLVVTDGERPVDVGPMKQRSLLGLLALHTGEVVPRGEIIDVLWGDQPPSSCLNLVHTYVSGLRRAVPQGRGELVRSVQGGYVLATGTTELDLLRFDDLVQRAHAADDPEAAFDLFGAALSGWRAPVLADLPPGVRDHPAAVAVSSRRLAAALAYADLALELGHADSAVDQLRPLTHQEPLHEGLHTRLMLALAAAGQQAAALEVFADLRGRLADDLGVEPGSELSTAHLRVLRNELPAHPASEHATPAKPAQLPAAAAGFVGRDPQLEQLDVLVRVGDEHAEPGPAIAVITGPAGVGKTALAVHWAHRMRDRFPDGQLHIDLRGYAKGSPIETIEALSRFLRALDVPSERVPTDEDEAAGLYRSLLADRRMLVVLDNAANAEQVRPLLPGGSGCLAVVTSRDRLPGLAAGEGAYLVALDVLAADEADTLLTRMIGAERARDGRAVVAELARLCAYLPLALRIAGANLAANPRATVARYVADLQQRGRVAELVLDRGGGGAVRAAFDLSYARLDAATRRLFRLLGLLPCPDFSPETVAALLPGTGRDAYVLLERLADVSLIQERLPGRYQFHDLLREYAADCAHTEDSAGERLAARQRAFDYYLGMVDEATSMLYPYLTRGQRPGGTAGSRATRWPSDTAASGWLDDERANLVHVVADAAQHGPRHYSWRIAGTLRDYFRIRGHCVEGRQICRSALAAARRESDEDAEVLVLGTMGFIHSNLSEYQQSIECHAGALAINEKNGNRAGQANSLLALGRAYVHIGRPQRADACCERALEIHRDLGDLRGEALALNHVGLAARGSGQFDRALASAEQTLALARRIDAPDIEVQALHSMGITNWVLGNLAEARRYYLASWNVAEAIGHRHGQAITTVCLAEATCDAGRYDEAEALARRGMALGRELAERRHEIIGLDVLATVSHRRGEHEKAVRNYHTALRSAREVDDGYSEISLLTGLTAAYRELGRLEDALWHGSLARERTDSTGMRALEGRVLAELAHVHLALGDIGKARDLAVAGLTVVRERRQRLAQARLLSVLGLVDRAAGDDTAAGECWREARDLFTDIGVPEAGQVGEFLDRT